MLKFILLLLIGLVLAGGYLFFYGFVQRDCVWNGTAQAWLDENKNGFWDAGEPALANVRFRIDDTRNGLTDVGQEARSNDTGFANLVVWLPGCPWTAFVVTAEPPPEYVPTTGSQISPADDASVIFGFALK